MISRFYSGAENSDIVVDLDASQRNLPVPADKLVQKRRYDELKDHVVSHLESIDPRGFEAPYPNGAGWVSFIDGTRGAGKSTFMASLLEGLRADKAINSHLAVMPLIDPSRVEKSEIILLSLLRLLQKRVAEVLTGRQTVQNDSLSKEWRRTFQRVAGGLALFAPQHHQLDGLDPELFLDWGLEQAGHSADLRQNLHILFSKACQIMNVRALMFAFDDADTDATHALNLLECIRKYLDTPQVMVVVTGDMELYSLLVRQHFSRSVVDDRSATIHADRNFFDHDRRAQYQRMLSHLEEQYLLKLFPLHHRLHLLPIWNLIQEGASHNYRYRLQSEAWERSTCEVKNLVNQLITKGFRLKSASDVEIFSDFILKQPLRSVLQILARCAPSISPNDYYWESQDWSVQLSSALASGLRALALTSLYRFGIDTDAIASRELAVLSNAVFELALRDGDMDTATYLRPTSADQDIKNCFVALAAEVPAFLTGKPGAMLRYLFYGPGSVSLFDMVRKRKLKDLNEDSGLLEGQFRRLMGIGRKESALNWSRYATAVIGTPYAVNPTTPVVRVGVIGLSRKGRNGQKFARRAIYEALFQDRSSSFPCLALSLVDVSGSTGRTFGSIFNIVGLMERMLDLPDPTVDTVERELLRAYPVLSVSSPIWESGGVVSSDDDNSDDEGNLLEEDWATAMHALATHVHQWLESILPLRKLVSPSAVLVGKIWTRLYFSLEKASDDLRSKASVPSLMEIFALCVIHAFLVEEMDHHLPTQITDQDSPYEFNRGNPRTSASAYVNNLTKLRPQRDYLPLTAIIATCPLLLGLLNPRLGYSDALSGLFPYDAWHWPNSMLCSPTHWDIFEQISIQGKISRGRKKGSGKESGAELDEDM